MGLGNEYYKYEVRAQNQVHVELSSLQWSLDLSKSVCCGSAGDSVV